MEILGFLVSAMPLLVLLVMLYLLASTHVAVRRIEERLDGGTADGPGPSDAAGAQ